MTTQPTSYITPLLTKGAQKTGEFIQKNILSKFKKPELNKEGQQIANFVQSAIKGAGDVVGQVRNIFAPRGEAAKKSIPPIVQQAEASYAGGGAFVSGTPANLQPVIAEAARKYGVSTNLLSALLKQESEFNPNAVSPVGARGIAQFMPDTARAYGVNVRDVKSSIEGAARLLQDEYKRFGDWDLALAAYNAGAGNVQKYGGIPPFEETQNYVRKIKQMAGEVSTPIPTKPPSRIDIKLPKIAQPAFAAETQKPTPTPSAVLRSSPRQETSRQQASTFRLPTVNIPQLPKVQLPKFEPPKIQIPQFQLPKVQLPKFEPPKPIQQAVRQVQNVAQNVGKFLGNLNPFRKK